MPMNNDHFHTHGPDELAMLRAECDKWHKAYNRVWEERMRFADRVVALEKETAELEAKNARLKKELEGPGVCRIKNPCTPEESETIRLALEKSNPVLGICREFHEGCRVARSVLFYALGIAATYQAKYFRLEFQSDRGALVRRKQRQAARLLDKARSGFYMEEETISTAQDALNGRR